MDPPQRATAAQMASRNIKSARKSKLNNRIASKDPNSVPQFATPSTEGSLFGGQFALPTESSGFNFALPNPVGFQPLSFAPAAKQVDEVEGVFQPGHYERDNRGGKRHTGWTPQSASIDGDYVNPEDRASEPKKYFGEDRLVAESRSVESSTKAPPQALGQSFTHSWPTATENPKASPQVLGQGFAGNWAKATEQPATLSSAFTFSIPQQETPVPTPEANPQPIANSSTSFGSAPTQTFATLFGQTPTVSQASNMGSTASTPAPPTNNAFGQSTPSNTNIFGQQVQAKPTTPATSFFGQVHYW